MTDPKTDINELPTMDEEIAMDEGVPEAPLGQSNGSAARQRRQNPNALSVISQKYDVDGDGVLDETERKMRDMDKSGRGFVKNEDVYAMMRTQLETQKQLFNMKRIVIGLGCFTVVLALSNLATAWAAAILAKDTQVSGQGDLQSKATGEILNTASKSQGYSLEDGAGSGASGRRGLQDDSATLTVGQVASLTTGANTYVTRTCSQNAAAIQSVHLVWSTSNDGNSGSTKYTDHTFVSTIPSGGNFQIRCPRGTGGSPVADTDECYNPTFAGVELTTCPPDETMASHANQCCQGSFYCSGSNENCECSGGTFACIPIEMPEQPQVATLPPPPEEPTAVECPAEQPASFVDSCSVEGQSCGYDPYCHTTDEPDIFCSTSIQYSTNCDCENGVWACVVFRRLDERKNDRKNEKNRKKGRRGLGALPPGEGGCTVQTDISQCNN